MTLRVTDQMGQLLELDTPPMRIVSLVPSQTELLFFLGLDKEVVGITRFCVHPVEQFRQKPRVGGTKNINFKKIRALQPDLIIGNKEENEKGQIEQLQAEFPVWMSDIRTLEEALEMIAQVGQLVQKPSAAQQLCSDIRKEFDRLEAYIQPFTPKSTAYLIWKNPYMVAASGTYIDHLMQLAGFNNIYHNKKRYPAVSIEELKKSAPEVLLLSSEPFPFKEKHIIELQSICPDTVIKLVDGELFSWYGNRLLYAVPYFINLHKELNT